MNKFKGGDPYKLGGFRRRSLSESEATELTTCPDTPNGPIGNLNFSSSLRLLQGGSSHPNLSCSDQGFISTPISEGANTRLGARRVDDNLHVRTVEEFHNLQNQIQQWMILISSDHQTDKQDIERVATTFINRINNLAQDCLLKKIDFKVHADILQLLPIIKKARRTHLRISGIPDDIEYEDSQDEEDDNIFLSQSQIKKLKEQMLQGSDATNAETVGEKEKPNRTDSDTNEENLFLSEEAAIISKTKELRHQQALTTIRTSKETSDSSMFNGFNTVFDELEEVKLMIERNKKYAETMMSDQTKKMISIHDEVSNVKHEVTSISSSVLDLSRTIESNSVRIGRLEEKQFNLNLTVKGVEKKILKRVSELVEWVESNLESQVDQSTPIKLPVSIGRTDELHSVRGELLEIRNSISQEKKEISNLKGSVKMIG